MFFSDVFVSILSNLFHLSSLFFLWFLSSFSLLSLSCLSSFLSYISLLVYLKRSYTSLVSCFSFLSLTPNPFPFFAFWFCYFVWGVVFGWFETTTAKTKHKLHFLQKTVFWGVSFGLALGETPPPTWKKTLRQQQLPKNSCFAFIPFKNHSLFYFISLSFLSKDLLCLSFITSPKTQFANILNLVIQS